MYTILIVDDSQTALFDIKRKLNKINPDYQIFLCENYELAVTQLNEGSIDLAFIDLQMPVKNGADLIIYMRSDHSLVDIPIVILTGTGEDSLLKTSLEKLVNEYLHKPVAFDTLKQVVDKHLPQ